MRSYFNKLYFSGLLAAFFILSACSSSSKNIPYEDILVGVADNGETYKIKDIGNNRVFKFTAGTYNYQIEGFGPGDKLIFDGGTISFWNGGTSDVSDDAFTDGKAEIYWQSDDSNRYEIKLTLVKLSEAEDRASTGVNNFNEYFGPDSISGHITDFDTLPNRPT